VTTPRFNHLSIDLETLGNRFDAPILSIGAVAFCLETGKQDSTFYQEVHIDSAIRSGHVSGDTLQWWMSQSEAARAIFKKETDPQNSRKMHLSSALQNFGTWCRSRKDMIQYPWGNGSTFDITILDHAFAKGSVGLEPPWAQFYWNIRDMRTLIDTAEQIAGFKKDLIKRDGVHHNALDDAAHQAKVIAAAWQALRGGKSATAKPAKTATIKPVDQATVGQEDDL
jgi:hypothetical protein